MIIRTCLVLSVASAFSACLFGQQRHASARDAFWSASDLISVTPNPAAHHAVKPKSLNPKPAAKPANDNGVVGETASGSTTEPPAGHLQSAVQLASENGYGATPHLVHTTESRLGLRYSVLLRDANGEYAEVRPGTPFHSGDHIRLSLMANEPGYLYVIEQGSSGNWSPLFPKAGSAADANRIEQGILQEIPGKASFQFDQQPGEDKLFVILSRTRIDDLDQRIEGLKGKPPGNADQPVAVGASMVEAENRIPDVFVQQLASRDLTLVDEEKVDQAATSSHSGEKAVYVVSRMTDAQGSGSEVVASIKLEHQ